MNEVDPMCNTKKFPSLTFLNISSLITGPASIRGDGGSHGRGRETDSSKREGSMGVACREGTGEERERGEGDGSPEKSSRLTETIQETGTIHALDS